MPRKTRKKGSISQTQGIIIFFAFFACVYVAVFMLISNNTGIYKIEKDTNNDRFFSADDIYYVVNIYNAEMDTSARIVKHPLMIPAASLFAFAEHTFLGEKSYYNHYRIIIIFQMLCFFISLIYIYKVLREHFFLSGVYVYIILSIYALAVSTLVYTFIAESYIISSMILIMSYYYILKGNAPVSVILGIFAAGITVTNAFIWGVMIISSKISVKKRVISLIAAAAGFFAVIAVTPAGEIFYDNLVSVFISSPDNYRDHFGLSETVSRAVFTIFGNTFFFFNTVEESAFGEFRGNAISFVPSADTIVIAATCFWLLLLLYCVIKNYRDRHVIIAGTVLLFNLLLHGVLQYGLKEGFLYSLHHLFAQLFIAASVFNIASDRIKKCIAALMGIYVIAMIAVNLRGFLVVLEFTERFPR